LEKTLEHWEKKDWPHLLFQFLLYMGHLNTWEGLGFFVALGFELRAYTLSHSTSPFYVYL
jgi:hypothetical protein